MGAVTTCDTPIGDQRLRSFDTTYRSVVGRKRFTPVSIAQRSTVVNPTCASRGWARVVAPANLSVSIHGAACSLRVRYRLCFLFRSEICDEFVKQTSARGARDGSALIWERPTSDAS
ncbi:hypothetical protein EVAR_7968_1 [Eumeta japonica]|uniref:Uncharacterized protein n=1 Tax=Eumeta variegata TaxID=151549 RepID=A0A4C1TKB1_EUMVA|nr:hypothetical protein EVAR_7968_1 [Eumeta japonica]